MDSDLISEIKDRDCLHWNYRNLITLPEELSVGIHIEDLYLKQNKLGKLPKWIGGLVNLTNLHLHGNELTDLPEEIGTLRSLVKLDIGCNKLKYVPCAVKSLNSLLELQLENNELVVIPEEIGLLTQLRKLDISRNHLKILPNTLGCCCDLEVLNLNNNQLRSIPNNIAFLPNLATLSASNNGLLYLPNMKFLNTVIDFSNNPHINYISHDFYSVLSDPAYRKSNLFWKFHCISDNNNLNNQKSFKHNLQNITLESIFHNKNTKLILPAELNKVFNENESFIPSLREIVLNKVYKMIKPFNRTYFFYNISGVPFVIKDALMRGPIAQCQFCSNYVFTECTVWIVPECLYCCICRETEFLTVYYFCSSSCAYLFKQSDEDELCLLQILKWTKFQ